METSTDPKPRPAPVQHLTEQDEQQCDREIDALIHAYVQDHREYPFIRDPQSAKAIRRREKGLADKKVWHPAFVAICNIIPGLGTAILGQKTRGLHTFLFFIALCVTCFILGSILFFVSIILSTTIILAPIGIILSVAASIVLVQPLLDMIFSAVDGGILASRLRRGYLVMPGEASFAIARFYGGLWVKPSFVYHSDSAEVPSISRRVNEVAKRRRAIRIELKTERDRVLRSAELDEMETDAETVPVGPVMSASLSPTLEPEAVDTEAPEEPEKEEPEEEPEAHEEQAEPAPVEPDAQTGPDEPPEEEEAEQEEEPETKALTSPAPEEAMPEEAEGGAAVQA